MLECITSRKVIKIGGQEFSAEVIKSQMLKINYEHIEYVLECLNSNTTKIYNIKAYLQTAVYKAPMTINSYFKAEVNHDLYGKRGNEKFE